MNETESKIAEFFVQREGDGILKTIHQMDLISSGIIDSLDLISLATHIEKKFQIKLDLTDPKVLTSLRHFNTIVELVKTKHK